MQCQNIDIFADHRGSYGQIIVDRSSSSSPAIEYRNAAALIEELSTRVDEHGGWAFGIESLNKRGGFVAMNWDLYHAAKDIHDQGVLFLIQVRQSSKRKSSHFTSVRKSYFLIGRNEDGTPFAHCVSHAPIFRAIADGRCPILAIQRWIFGVDYAKVIRQGDLALIPTKRPQGSPYPDGGHATIAASHEVEADEIRTTADKRLFALNPRAVHVPQTHPTVAVKGWFEIRLGARALAWDFAKTKID